MKVHISWVVVLMLLFGAGVILTSQPAWALIYKCVDSSGQSIFTDSPPQMNQCQVVHQKVSSGPASTVQPLPSAVGRHEYDEAMVASAAAPVSRAGRSLVVQARLNGTRDAKLIVDTGANITVLSRQVARDAGIWPTSYSGSVTLNTAGGPVQADLARLDALAVGSEEVSQVSVAIHDLPEALTGVDGLLGLSFLDKFLVTMDTQKGELQLRRRE